MSNEIPTFSEGDRVRIMQTSQMEIAGLANKTGIVDTIWQDGAYIVLLDNGGIETIKGANLMRAEA